jgi:hypothetical protein
MIFMPWWQEAKMPILGAWLAGLLNLQNILSLSSFCQAPRYQVVHVFARRHCRNSFKWEIHRRNLFEHFGL